MEKKSIDFYRTRRLEKHKQRQSRQIRQLSLIASLLMLGIITIVILVSKPSVANIKTKTTTAKNTTGQEAIPPEKPVVMANQDSLKLFLPVKQSQLTAIGFHEAFNPQSVSLKPKGTEINAKDLSKTKLIKIKKSTKGLIYSLMWRGARAGPLNSSVDIGSKPGTINHSPVSGRVFQVKKYSLYGRYPDNEVHILPEGYNDRHLVIIHIRDLQVKTGNKLVAGQTPIGRTQKFSAYFRQQLSDYSKDAGDHVHFQVNKLVNGKCHPD